MPFREFHFQWEFEFQATPEQLWPFVADTNRFNRDTKVPQLQFDSDEKRMPNARRRVRLSIYGMPIEWEEQPFEWVKPFRFGIERVYSKGPMAQMRALGELTPIADNRTKLSYKVWATPRNVIGLVAIPLQIKFLTAPRFRSAFQRYGTLAMNNAQRYIPPDMATAVDVDQQRLNALKQKLLGSLEEHHTERGPGIVNKLAEFLVAADDFAVGRIRAYHLADEWRESRRDVLEICLLATRVGILDLQWDILCPHCRGAKDASSLRDIPSGGHCGTCNVDFTVTFDRFVELTFRPNAAVRRVNVGEYCIGSPERTPHVVAQQLLKPGEERKLTLPLESGNYRLRALELPGALSVAVAAGAPTSASIIVTANGWNAELLQIGERSELDFKNDTEDEHLIILERTAWTDQATTAAEVTALQMFRDLFSSEALRPG
jgi:hypothetical protein